MHRGLHLPAVRRRVASASGGIVGAAKLGYFTGCILHDLFAGDEIRVTQAHLAPRREPKELLRRILHEVFLLDIDLPSETELARSSRRVVRMVRRLQLIDLAVRPVLDHDLQRPQHRHTPRARSRSAPRGSSTPASRSRRCCSLSRPPRVSQNHESQPVERRGGAGRRASAYADRPSRSTCPERTSSVSTRFERTV